MSDSVILEPPLLPAAAVVSFILIFVYLFVRPVVICFRDKNGFRKYPSMNAVCGITNLGFVWESFQGNRTLKLHRMHQKHPIIRIGPNSLSFCDARVVQDIYGHSTTCREDEMYRAIQGDSTYIPDVVEKEEFLKKRRLVSNSYASRNVATWVYKVVDKVRRLIARFDEYCDNDEVLDFRRWSNLFTVEAIADIALSHKLGFLESGNDVVPVEMPDGTMRHYDFIHSLHSGNEVESRTAWEATWLEPLNKVLKVFNPRFRHLSRHGDRFGEIVKSLLRQRLAKGLEEEKFADFFQSLIKNRDGSFRDVKFCELKAEATLTLNAGSDTTAIQLNNIMYHLLKNPEKLDSLRQELSSVPVQDGDVIVAYDDAKPLTYLRACLDEALRITPPVAFGLPRRTPPESSVIGDTMVPGNMTVSIPAWTAHRDEKWFPDPEAYQPERWLAENASKLQAQFIAFSAGARGCLRRNMSYIKQYVLMASL